MMITTTCRSERANPDARNFGLGSRDPAQAAANAARESFNRDKIGGLTENQQVNHFKDFLNYHAGNDSYIKDLRDIEIEHIDKYAENLADRVSNEEIVAGTASNYLSSVNSLMSQIAGYDELHSKSAASYGIPGRTGIAKEDREVTESQLAEVKENLSEHHAAMLDLQREIGLRFEESAKFDAVSASINIEAGASSILIEDGTKGSRDRFVELTNEAKDAVFNAAEIQQNARSMIPADLSYREFKNECYNAMRKEDISHHDLRHTYAHEQYRSAWEEKGFKDIEPPIRTDIEPPAVGSSADMQRYMNDRIGYLEEKTGLSRNEVCELENEIRLEISEKLGHSRVPITNNYLG
jgi:integrase